jgi:UDP-N-acetylglucosamine 3-dehydrogenase
MTRLGMIGIGDMAEVHAAAATRIGVPLAIAIGQNRERAEALAASTGAVLYGSVDELLADPGVTAVDLCVPNDLHRTMAERAFAAGKHVLCEKPIALTLEDADAMLAAAENAGVTFMVGHLVRFWPEYQRFRNGVLSGEFGEVKWLTLRRLTGVLSATAGREDWRANVARSGGAALDLQIHDLDFACWVFGNPNAVYGRGVRSPGGTWDHLLTSVTFDTCSVGIEASFLMQGAPFEISFQAVTDKGAVLYRYSPQNFALHGLHGEGEEESSATPEASLRLYPAGQPPVDLYVPERDSFEVAMEAEIQAFIDAIATGSSPISAGSDARRSLAAALASLHSCETSAVVNNSV